MTTPLARTTAQVVAHVDAELAARGDIWMLPSWTADVHAHITVGLLSLARAHVATLAGDLDSARHERRAAEGLLLTARQRLLYHAPGALHRALDAVPVEVVA